MPEKTIPTNTHRILVEKNRVQGYVDNVDAMKQAIYLILNTERYEFPIYSWDYGVEFVDLFGKDPNYVIVAIRSRITEALLQDDRITAVENFNITSNKHKLLVTFTVRTIFGNIDMEQGVSI